MDSWDAVLEDYLSRLDHGDAPHREEYLQQHPQHAAALRELFDNLDFVDNHLGGGSPASVSQAPCDVQDELADHALPPIPGFALLEELGRGSQGVVYKAEQLGTKRVVALKVVRDGRFASSAERRRFEVEVQLASRLTHPNIVSIYHRGNDGGFDHFAMEYVDGEPLDVYLGNRPLDVETTLRLFLQVCDGVAYAHQRGVIHRDLKPSNMIVDAAGTAHILDFGLAKSVPGSAEPSLAVTHTGEFAGTWYYASPEQAARNPDLVDIRTDVYALGVVLYEMLTDCYPYPVVDEPREVVARHIRETPPARPSLLRSEINDELDTIVLHALRKDPGARYQSATAFADDVRRFLAGEPIAAKRDSRWYLLYATARRYRWYVAAACTGFAVVIGLAFMYAVLYWRATTAQATAEARSDLARRMQVDLLGQLNELNTLANAHAALVNADPALADRVLHRRPPFAGSLEPWLRAAADAPSDLVANTLSPDDPASTEAMAWLERHAEDFTSLLTTIASFDMTAVTSRTSEWEISNNEDNVNAPRRLTEILIALGYYQHVRGDRQSAIAHLEAARQYALDLADGDTLFHKGVSIESRHKLYDVVLAMLTDGITADLDPALASWVLRDPPLVGQRLAMISEAIKLEQIWEAATVATGDGDGFIDMARLDELTGGYYTSLGLRDLPTLVHTAHLQDLMMSFFREIQSWDDLPVPVMEQRHALLRSRISADPAWLILKAMLPGAKQSLRARAIAGAKRRAAILAVLVLQHRRENGEWPPDLQTALSPGVQADSLYDTYCGARFGYGIVGDAPVIYSLNLDGIDDSAHAGSWDEPHTDVILFPVAHGVPAVHGAAAVLPSTKRDSDR